MDLLKPLMRLALLTPAIVFPMNIYSAEKPVWQEAEDYAGVHSRLEEPTKQLPLASGGKATAGALYSSRDSLARYVVELPTDMEDARIVLRYARLHWREGMQPAGLTIEAHSGDSVLNAEVSLGNTGGWGRSSASEWSFAEAPLGKLKKGKVEIVLQSVEETCDANIDGFYILPKGVTLSDDVARGLNRVFFAADHVVGIDLRDAPVLQGEYDGFNIVGTSLGRKSVGYSARLLDAEGKTVQVLVEDATLDLGNGRAQAHVSPEPVRDLEDGSYRLEVKLGDGRLFEMPFIPVGNLVGRVKGKLNDYRRVISGLDAPARVGTLLPDLQYAVDYIQNTLLLLESRRRGDEDSANNYRAALAYFENSRQRSTQDFADDLRKIIAQTDETLERLERGGSPYEERTGEMRRAFVSDATGELEPYRIFVPKAYEALDSIPMLLLLHGGGGDENYFPDLEGGAILDTLEQRPYLMVSPRSSSWYEGDGLKDLEQLVAHVRKLYPTVDADRIYCSGVSRGGFGSYSLAVHKPGLLRGIACVSGTSRDNEGIEKLRGTPVLIIHGGTDPVVLPAVAKETARQLDELGYEHRLEIFPQNGHDYKVDEYLNLTLDYFEQVEQEN